VTRYADLGALGLIAADAADEATRD